ncbi:hypothetical protein DDV93_17135 [Cereibacter johrii]|nr:hypothetical protein DDV93_17135 [Cereibacter johrii]
MMSHNVLQSMQLLGDAAGSFTDNMGVGTQERRRGRLDAPAAAPPRAAASRASAAPPPARPARRRLPPADLPTARLRRPFPPQPLPAQEAAPRREAGHNSAPTLPQNDARTMIWR